MSTALKDIIKTRILDLSEVLALESHIEISRTEVWALINTAKEVLAQRNALLTAAKVAEKNIQGILDGNDLASLVIRDMLRAAIAACKD